MLGDEAILIANVPAPSVADLALNGITVEFEHCKGDESPHLVSIKQLTLSFALVCSARGR